MQRRTVLAVFLAGAVLLGPACAVGAAALTFTAETCFIDTLAGKAFDPGYADGVATRALFSTPAGIATDGKALFVSDSFNSVIRSVDPATAKVGTVVGLAYWRGDVDGAGKEARFSIPRALAVSGSTLFVVDQGGVVIRAVDIPSGTVSTVAGRKGNEWADGVGQEAGFGNVDSLVAAGKYLYAADGDCIRRIDISSGTVSTLAGAHAQPGTRDGPAGTARFSGARWLATDGLVLYIASDTTVRRLDLAGGTVTTIAGKPGELRTRKRQRVKRGLSLTGLFLDGRSLYLLEYYRIRRIDLSTYAITTVAQTTGAAPGADGPGTSAGFNQPTAMTRLADDLYFTDATFDNIRRLTPDARRADTDPREARLALVPRGGAARFGRDFMEHSPGIWWKPLLHESPWPLVGLPPLEHAVYLPYGPRRSPVTDQLTSFYGSASAVASAAGVVHVLVLDRSGTPDEKLYFDTNGNGDLSDDPPAEWAVTESKGPRGTVQLGEGGAWMDMPWDTPARVFIAMYRDPGKFMPGPGDVPILDYSDFYREGTIPFGARSVHAFLFDLDDVEDFRGTPNFRLKATGMDPDPGIYIGLDLDADGQINPNAELFPVSGPFFVDGVAYRITHMTSSGGSFVVSRVVGPLSSAAPWKTVKPGENGPAWTIRTVTGQEFALPPGTKGSRLLLLWPNRGDSAELRILTDLYAAFHLSGLEILEVGTGSVRDALPRQDKLDQAAGRPWHVLFDGLGFRTPLITLYGDPSRPGWPSARLIDAATGRLLDNDLRIDGTLKARLKSLLAG